MCCLRLQSAGFEVLLAAMKSWLLLLALAGGTALADAQEAEVTNLWSFPLGKQGTEASPALAPDGTVYFGSWDKNFYALAPDGMLKWKFATGGEITASPALGADDAVYFSSTDGNLYALNTDGTSRWQQHTGGSTSASPVLDEAGNIYLAVNRELYSFTAEGKPRWHYHIGYPATTSVLALAGNVIFSAMPYTDSGLVNSDGHFLWLLPSGHGFFSSLNLTPASAICYADETSVNVFRPSRNISGLLQPTAMTLAKSSWPMWRGNPQHTGRVDK